ncbi:hypothetical protein [Sphingobacterium multivorum]|uniref:hypothetical protein n=1 Tax=Sphingobacterium multivorum TaxID=28454 RepID=UPI0028ABD2B7|nr:hypothetical protein [Sphingobacterium multivorum]
MIYLYLALLAAIMFALFKFFASGKKPDDVSLSVYYCFQEHPGQYSGSLRATHGAFVFRGERFRDDVINIVVKDVRCMDQRVEVKLQQILVLAFKENAKASTEVSVRFRIGSDKAERVDLTKYKVRVNAVVSYQNGEKKAFSTVLPMMGVYHNHPEKPGDLINK